jgi:hypothetical protein
MAFPTNLTNAVDGITDVVADHLNHLEAKVGIDGSLVTTSLDYLLKNPASKDPGHLHSLSGMANLAANSIIGNNTALPTTPMALSVSQVKTLMAISQADVVGLTTTSSPTFVGLTASSISSPGALGLNAGGTNQNIALTPSGSGFTLVTGDFCKPTTGTAANWHWTNEFNAGNDVAIFGYNRNQNCGPVISTEYQAYKGIESNYDNGISHFMEMYWRVSTPANPGPSSLFESIGAYFDRIANRITVANISADTVSITNGAKIGSTTTYAKFTPNGAYLSFVGWDTDVINSVGIGRINISQGIGGDPYAIMMTSGNSAFGAKIVFAKTRSTGTDANVICQAGDTVMDLSGVASGGTDFRNTARITFNVEGTPGSATMPGGIRFLTTKQGDLHPTERLRIDNAGNIGVSISAFGTNAAKVLGINSGTAPTTAPADMAQIWVADINGAAGYAGLHKRTETTNLTEVIPGVVIKTTMGRSANPYEGLMEINQFDNGIYWYADGAWRTIVTW